MKQTSQDLSLEQNGKKLLPCPVYQRQVWLCHQHNVTNRFNRVQFRILGHNIYKTLYESDHVKLAAQLKNPMWKPRGCIKEANLLTCLGHW